MQVPVLHCFTLAFTSADIIFHNFSELHSTLSGLFRMIYTFTEMFGSPSKYYGTFLINYYYCIFLSFVY